MPEFIPHFCTGVGCESMHAGHGETEAVKIAKINREADIEIARIQRSEARQAIEAETEQTEVMAEAQVESAVAEAVVTAAIIGSEGGEPEAPAEPEVVAMPDPPAEPVESTPGPPEVEHNEPEGKKSKGYWDSYS